MKRFSSSFLFFKPFWYRILSIYLVLMLLSQLHLSGAGIPVTAEFNANKTNVIVGETVTFSDQSVDNGCDGGGSSTDGVDTWTWDFGVDASPANASTQGPHAVTYSSVGTKTITLDADGSDIGCLPDSNGFSLMISVLPAIPTLSEWGLILLALLLMNLGSVFIAQEKLALAIPRNFKLPFTSLQLPFSAEYFNKAMVLTAIFAFVGFAGSIALTGTIAASDLIGVFVTAPVFAYLVHLVWIIKEK